MKNKYLKKGLVFSLLLAFVFPLQVTAAGEPLIKEMTIKAASEAEYKELAEAEFAQQITENGKDYTLDHIDYEITDTQYLDKKEKVIDVTGEPEQTLTEQGVVYTLENAEKQEQDEAEPQIVTAYDDYDHPVSESDVPGTKDVTATNSETGEEETVTCSLTGIEPAGITTVDTVMTITFSNYDASYYSWNGTYIARNDQTPPLAGYEDELLAYCNAEAGSEITGYYWAGEPYTSNSVLCRDAAANVRQNVRMYRANYQGEIAAPEQEPVYAATYTAPDPDGAVQLTVTATATYIQESSVLPYYIAAGAGILVLIILIVGILIILSKKKKEKAKE